VAHRNAPLSELGRLRLARCVVEQGWPVARAAERFQISRPTALARNSGIVTAITGPDGTQPSQFGELTCFAVTKDANEDAAKLVEFLMNDGYLDWLALAPKARSRSAPAPATSKPSSPMPGTTSRLALRTESRCRSSTRPAS
jgi:hypothetical protein